MREQYYIIFIVHESRTCAYIAQEVGNIQSKSFDLLKKNQK